MGFSMQLGQRSTPEPVGDVSDTNWRMYLAGCKVSSMSVSLVFSSVTMVAFALLFLPVCVFHQSWKHPTIFS